MRNYISKSAFRQPLTSNSFRQSDRINIDPVPVSQYNSKKHLINKKQESMTEERVQIPIQLLPIIPRNQGQISSKYFLYLQNSLPIIDRNSHQQIEDDRCLWYLPLQKLPGRQRKLIFEDTDYTITEWAGDKFPIVIYLTIQGAWGYLNEHSVVTDRMLALQLRQISPYESDNLVKYGLRYSSTKEVHWQLPSELTHIKLGVKIDNSLQNLTLPLPNPLLLNLKICQIKQQNLKTSKNIQAKFMQRG